MLTEAELLQYIYQTTEMGRDGIQSVLPHAEDETFHQALEQQLTEYEKLYGATGKMLAGTWSGAQGAQSHGQGILRDDERDENHG
ncbi:MAG: hypothetical protein ACLRNQ_26405 [Flavonifractor plautii]